MKQIVTRAATALALALLLAPAGVAAAHPATVHTVRPGESIQAALDRARPGDTVRVRPGTYRENLELSTDRVTLLGYGATLAAPGTPVHRRCSVEAGAETNEFGVCVIGVHDVTIRGLTVTRFPNIGIVAFGAVGTRIEHTDVTGGASYGILLADNSSGSVVTANRVHGGVNAGIYIGDSPDALATITGNEVFDSGVFGIFVRNASRGKLAGNSIRGNCIGVGFVPTRPDPATVTGWRVVANRIHGNDRGCPVGSPPLTAAGVVIMGANDIAVTHNVITGNAPLDAAAPTRGGGVVLVGSETGGPAQPTGNRVQHNVLLDNHPYDLAVLDDVGGNRVSGNVCRTSTPAGLCAGRHDQ